MPDLRPNPSSGHLRDSLAKFTSLHAPTGFEEPVLKAAAEPLNRSCDSLELDLRGNLYATIKGKKKNAPRIMLTAHADEVGFMVTSVTPQGFLKITRLGHPSDQVLPGQPVVVLAAEKPIPGIIGVKPGHILSPQEARQIPPLEQLYVDVAAEGPSQIADWGIEPGTPIVFHGPLESTAHPDRVVGKAIDNRIGIVCLLELAVWLSKHRPPSDCVFVITVEEEIGLRGAAVATLRANPHIVLAIDTVPSGGTPDLSPTELPWNIGLGPLIKVREIKGLATHPSLRNRFRDQARKSGIPCQWIVDTAGITDATSAQQAGPDIAALTLGLPRRYSHAAVELLDLRDAAHLIDLIALTLPSLDSVDDLRRIRLP